MKKLSIGALAVALVFASALAWQGMVPTKVDASELSVLGGCPCSGTTFNQCAGGGDCDYIYRVSCVTDFGGTCRNLGPGCIGNGCTGVTNYACDK